MYCQRLFAISYVLKHCFKLKEAGCDTSNYSKGASCLKDGPVAYGDSAWYQSLGLGLCRHASSLALLADSSGQMRLLCRSLHSKHDEKAVVKLDPSYYSFMSCFCEEGYSETKQYDNGVLVAISCTVPEVRRCESSCSSSSNPVFA
jgi:hypothetical protein